MELEGQRWLVFLMEQSSALRINHEDHQSAL